VAVPRFESSPAESCLVGLDTEIAELGRDVIGTPALGLGTFALGLSSLAFRFCALMLDTETYWNGAILWATNQDRPEGFCPTSPITSNTRLV
jgi:hypothetical protein